MAMLKTQGISLYYEVFVTFAVSALFLVFGRSVVYPTVAKSGSESGYKISGRRKHGQNSLARERGRQSDRALAPRRSAKESPAAV